MNKDEILNTIKILSNSYGFYGRLYAKLSDDSNKSKELLTTLEDQHFKDMISLILYLEDGELVQ